MKLASSKGFTLIEIFVAVSIAAVIGYFVVSFSLSLASVWRANESSVGTRIEANLVLDVIGQDLQSAVMLERGGDVMFAVSALKKSQRNEGNDGRGWVDQSGSVWRDANNDFDPANDVYGWAGSWIRFFTAAPTLNAVAYQIVRRPSYGSSTESRYGLFRSIVRQDYTEQTGFDISASSYDAAGDPAFDSRAKTITKPNLNDLISENIVDFGMRLYIYDENATATAYNPRGLRLIYPANNLGVLSNADTDRTHLASSFDPGDKAKMYPDVAEVFVRVLDAEGARMLESAEEQGGSQTFEQIVAEHSRLFSRMIEIGGARNSR